MKWHYSSLSSFNLQELIPPLCQNPKMTFKLTCRLSNYKSKLHHILLSGLSKLQKQTEHIRDNNTTAFAFYCSPSFSLQLLSLTQFFLSPGGEIWRLWAACGCHQRSSLVWFRGQISLCFVQFNSHGQPRHTGGLQTEGLVSHTHTPTLTHTHIHKHIQNCQHIVVVLACTVRTHIQSLYRKHHTRHGVCTQTDKSQNANSDIVSSCCCYAFMCKITCKKY